MNLYATAGIAGTLESQPDFRVPPNTFAEYSETRQTSLQKVIADFLATTGLGSVQVVENAQAAQAAFGTPQVTQPKLTDSPLFWLAAGALAVYVITK